MKPRIERLAEEKIVCEHCGKRPAAIRLGLAICVVCAGLVSKPMTSAEWNRSRGLVYKDEE